MVLSLFREQDVTDIFEPGEINIAYSYPSRCSSSFFKKKKCNRKGKFQSVFTWLASKAVPVERSAFHLLQAAHGYDYSLSCMQMNFQESGKSTLI